MKLRNTRSSKGIIFLKIDSKIVNTLIIIIIIIIIQSKIKIIINLQNQL